MDTKHPKYNEDFLKLRLNPRAGDGNHEYFTCKDGTRLFLQYWLPEGGDPKRVVICLHGMSAQGWYYSLIADELVPHGVAVYVPDLRHHGMSGGKPGDSPNLGIIVDDVRQLAEWVRARHPGAKLFTLGESMGGAININLAIDAPQATDGIVLIAPAIKPAMKFTLKDIFLTPFYLLVLIIHSGWRVIKVTGTEPLGMRNPDNIRYDQNDPLHLKYVSPRFLLGVKKMMDRGAKEGPEKIKIPSLIIQGGMDVAVSAQGTREFHEKLTSTDKTFKFFPEGFHCMQTDPICAAELRSTIKEWVLAH
jgi:acylglycerol lipase